MIDKYGRYGKAALIVFVASASLGCGGGGGDGAPNSKDETFYGGIYRGVILESYNSCGIPAPASGSIEWTVNQDGSRIVLDTGKTTFEGQAGPLPGMFTAEKQVDSSGHCHTTSEASCLDITDDSANAEFQVTVVCGGGAPCVIRSTGRVTRSLH